jgi:hypothetical protein
MKKTHLLISLIFIVLIAIIVYAVNSKKISQPNKKVNTNVIIDLGYGFTKTQNSIYVDGHELYSTSTAGDPIEYARQYMINKLPTDDKKLIEIAIATYYDLIIYLNPFYDSLLGFYGYPDSKSLFRDKEGNDVIKNYFSAIDQKYYISNQIPNILFRSIFIKPKSTAYTQEIQKIDQPVTGGVIVGLRHNINNDVTVFTMYQGEENLGPSLYNCKESTTNIDKIIFEKYNDKFMITDIQKNIDSWQDTKRSETDLNNCESINQTRIKTYQISDSI